MEQAIFSRFAPDPRHAGGPHEGGLSQAISGAWGTVPNNLAHAGVPSRARRLEVKLLWGDTVLACFQAFDRPTVTIGAHTRNQGCDLHLPVKELSTHAHILACALEREASTYLILPPAHWIVPSRRL